MEKDEIKGLLIVLSIIFSPTLILCAIECVFGLHIDLTFKRWVAINFLVLVFS